MDKRLAKQVLIKYTGVRDDLVLEETHGRFARLFEKILYIKREGLRNVVQLLGETDRAVSSIKLDSIVEDRYVSRLETSGFIQNLYR